MTATQDPKERFTSRVGEYVRYRPRYPSAVLDVLAEETGLEATWLVADVGSGTGISTELFLDHGNAVFAVEPNDEMRRAAEAALGGRPGFTSVAGSAEETGLPRRSVDIVAAGQAFHWFDEVGARDEFLRILRDPGWVALFWNTRLTRESAFLRDYEDLLERFGTDYARVRHDRPSARLERFFGGRLVRRVVPNRQVLDHDGLRGRLLSSSYTPLPDHPDYDPMLEALDRLFERHASGGTVEMPYRTEVVTGRLS